MFGWKKPKKPSGPRHSDVEYIIALQSEDRDGILAAEYQRMGSDFYNDCLDYFYRSSDAVIEQKGKRAVEESDVFHDSFEKLWQEIRTRNIYLRDNYPWRIDSSGTGRRMTASLTTFLMAIAKNRNYEVIREEAKYVDRMVSDQDSIDTGPHESTHEIIVRSCVNKLPKRCQEILTLFYYDGMSLDQILEVRQENQSKDGLKSGKSKCMSQLKKRILEEFNRNNLRPYGHE